MHVQFRHHSSLQALALRQPGRYITGILLHSTFGLVSCEMAVALSPRLSCCTNKCLGSFLLITETIDPLLLETTFVAVLVAAHQVKPFEYRKRLASQPLRY